MQRQQRRAAAGHHRRQAHFTPTATFSSTTSATSTTQPQQHTTPEQHTTPATSPTTPSTTQHTTTTTPLLPPLFPPTTSTSTTPTTTSTSTTPTSTTPTSTSTKPTTPATSPTTQQQAPTTPVVSTPTSIKSSTALVTAPMSTTGSAGSSVSQTGTPESSSSGHTGAILGGVAGALIGIAALAVTVSFVMRRLRKRRDENEAANFDPGEFRRSAMMLNDDHISVRGHTPRPPSMLERRFNPPPSPMSFGAQYGYPGPNGGYNGGAAGQYHPQQPSYAQEYVPGPYSPTYSNPFSSQPSTPVTTNSAHGLLHDPSANLGATPYFTRNSTSSSSNHSHTQRYSDMSQLGPNPNANMLHSPSAYSDTARTSAAFQEAQYIVAEHQTALPPLPPTALASPTPSLNKPLPSPFGDHDRPGHQNVSSIDIQVVDAQGNEGKRISVPPFLPEIHIGSSGEYKDDFPASVGNSPASAAFDAAVKPSPIVAAAAETPKDKKQVAPPSPTRPQAEEEKKKPRPDTVYDDDDVYGGI